MLNKKIWAALLSSGLMLTSSGMLYAQAAPAEEDPISVGQNAPQEVPAAGETASEALEAYANKKGWEQNWDPVKKRIFVIGSAGFSTKNPKSKDFTIRREMAAKRALMEAKLEIISQMAQQMSAEDKLDIPGCDLAEKFQEEKAKLDQALYTQSEELAKLLEAVNKAEADTFRQNVDTGERLNALFDAVLKKLDASYDTEGRDAQYQARLKKAKEQYAVAKASYDKMLEEAKKADQVVKETQTSSVAAMATMPIFGVTVVQQKESWIDGQYEIAVLATWSHKLERAARAVVTGEDFKFPMPKKPMTVNQWLNSRNLAQMIGPRTFVDKNRERWFLGISANDASAKNYRIVKNNERIARLNAMATAVYCLYSDVKGQAEAQQMMQTSGDATDEEGLNDKVKAAQSLAESMSQKFSKMTVRGLQKLASKKVVHPITHTKMIVVVYGINAGAAKDALANERRNIATKIQYNRHQTVERGRQAANKAAIDASADRADDFQEGQADQSNKIVKKLEKRDEEHRNRTRAKARAASRKAAPAVDPNQAATGGVFGEDEEIEDDF